MKRAAQPEETLSGGQCLRCSGGSRGRAVMFLALRVGLEINIASGEEKKKVGEGSIGKQTGQSEATFP